MAWTLLVLLTVSWLLLLLAGIGGPWSWFPPAAIVALLLYRIAMAVWRK